MHGYQELTRDQKKHIYKNRKGNKDDWQVRRGHFVDKYFVPLLFFQRHQKVYSPGEGLRRDWKSNRQHMINHYFNPSLFDEPPRKILSWGEYQRENWKTTREFNVDEFFEPSLFEEQPLRMGKEKMKGITPKEKIKKGKFEPATWVQGIERIGRRSASIPWNNSLFQNCSQKEQLC